MNISIVRALVTGSIVTGAAVAALSAPAQAMQAPAPPSGVGGPGVAHHASSGFGWPVDQAAEGVLVGLLVVGGGMAAGVRLRRHGAHASHPA